MATELQLAGDGENDKGRFLGHNGLSPTLAERRERESEQKRNISFFISIWQNSHEREGRGRVLPRGFCQRFLKSVSRGSAFLLLTPRKLVHWARYSEIHLQGKHGKSFIVWSLSSSLNFNQLSRSIIIAGWWRILKGGVVGQKQVNLIPIDLLSCYSSTKKFHTKSWPASIPHASMPH